MFNIKWDYVSVALVCSLCLLTSGCNKDVDLSNRKNSEPITTYTNAYAHNISSGDVIELEGKEYSALIKVPSEDITLTKDGIELEIDGVKVNAAFKKLDIKNLIDMDETVTYLDKIRTAVSKHYDSVLEESYSVKASDEVDFIAYRFDGGFEGEEKLSETIIVYLLRVSPDEVYSIVAHFPKNVKVSDKVIREFIQAEIIKSDVITYEKAGR